MTITRSLVACRPVHIAAWGWLALHAAALWPHGLWALRRLADGSDDPLGLAALAALVLWLGRAAPTLRVQPRLGWLQRKRMTTPPAIRPPWRAARTS